MDSQQDKLFRGGSRTVATFKIEIFVTIFNKLEPLTIVTKSSILDVAAALDLPLLLQRNENTLEDTKQYSMMRREQIHKLQSQTNLNQINSKLNGCKKKEKWMDALTTSGHLYSFFL